MTRFVACLGCSPQPPGRVEASARFATLLGHADFGMGRGCRTKPTPFPPSTRPASGFAVPAPPMRRARWTDDACHQPLVGILADTLHAGHGGRAHCCLERPCSWQAGDALRGRWALRGCRGRLGARPLHPGRPSASHGGLLDWRGLPRPRLHARGHSGAGAGGVRVHGH